MHKMFGFRCSMAPIMRNFEELKKERFNEENESTITSEDQVCVHFIIKPMHEFAF